MRILLDTHTFLWFIQDDPKLRSSAKRIVEEVASDVYVSIASLWEVAIKAGIGKLRLKASFEELIPDLTWRSTYTA